MSTATSRTTVDGRTARRLENREKIVDAALALVEEGAEIDMDTIAARAGVSVRSVYNHFPTARHLVEGMYERGTERVRELVADLPGPSEGFDKRVVRWVQLWARVQEEIAAIRWRALIAEEKHPELQPEIADLRKRHRAEIRRAFPEISDKSAVAAAVAITDSLTWRALRKHQGLSVDAACKVIEETLRRLAT